jgi:hypothetical protein
MMMIYDGQQPTGIFQEIVISGGMRIGNHIQGNQR